jgi:hypothetical protein
MFEEGYALAEIPAEDDDFDDAPAPAPAPVPAASSPDSDRGRKRPRDEDGGAAEASVREEKAAAAAAAATVAAAAAAALCDAQLALSRSEHERILAEFCMNEEDTAGIVNEGAAMPAAEIPPPAPPSYELINQKLAERHMIWESKMMSLVRYGNQFGHCNVPHQDTYDDNGETICLGAWVCKQRAQKKQNRMLPERLKFFEELIAAGKFSWDMADHIDCVWHSKYDALMEYKKIVGHCNPPFNYTHVDSEGVKVNLGEWVILLRRQKREGLLTGDHDILITVSIMGFFICFYLILSFTHPIFTFYKICTEFGRPGSNENKWQGR